MVKELHSDETEERQAARLALLSYRASQGPSAEAAKELALVIAESTVQSLDEALMRLADHRKPMNCVPSIDGRTLILRCNDLTDPTMSALHQATIAEMEKREGIFGDIREAYEGGGMSGNLLLIGYGEQLHASVAVFERFTRDYVLPFGLSINGRPAEQEELDLGVFYVIELGKTEEIITDLEDWIGRFQ